MLQSTQFPTVIEASHFGRDLDKLVATCRMTMEDGLRQSGAVLFKKTSVRTAEQFGEFSRLVSHDIPDFKEESSPRSVVHGHVLTSTDYPHEYPIQFHTEYSYASKWPLHLQFCCLHPPAVSGETPISDTRQVLANMRPSTRAAFERKGVLYVRNYRPNAGVSWQAGFGTQDPDIVEKVCEEAKIECEWRSGDVLHTRQRGAAVVRHPKTGDLVWFNHALIFNVRAFEPAALRDTLMNCPEDDPLSANTLFGDGTPINAEIIEELRGLYADASSRRPWEQGDILIIDNMLTAHGRAPFQGKRSIVVVMTDSIARSSVESIYGDEVSALSR